MKKLSMLKIVIACLYGLFVGLTALGQILEIDALTVVGLMAFTVAAALTTYYMLETQT